MEENSFIKNILMKKDTLPKQQRSFCDFLIENYYSITLDSVAEMAEKASVGTTTILRTVSALGYDSFNEFKRDIHASVLELTTPKWYQFNQEDSSHVSSIEETWHEINQLQKATLNPDLLVSIEKTIDLMIEANTIHILGLRTSQTAAVLFENLVNVFYPKVNQLSHDPSFVFDKMFHFKEGDMLIVIALSPFTKMTLEAAKYCNELGHPIILITDHNSCSIIPFATVVLKTLSNRKQYSVVPVISLIETLTIELGRRIPDESSGKLDEIGKLLVKKEIITL